MLPKKLIIFIYLLFIINQLCIASGIFYTNTYVGNSLQNGSIHKVDLIDNSFIKIIDNAILHDVKEDQSTLIFSNVNNQYGYISEMESAFIIKNFYNYDTLSISGYDARFNSDGSKIIFTSSFTNELYEYESFSSLDIYSTVDSTTTELSDSIFFGYYLLSGNKNKVLWTEKNNLIDSLNIHVHDINLDQTDILNAKLPAVTYGSSILNNLFWGKNNILFASFSDTNNTKKLYSLDMDQNTQSFSEVSSFDTTGLYMILNTQDFNQGKFLFSRMIPPDTPTEMYHLEIWVHDIYNEVSEHLFNFNNGQIPLNYFWTSDTSSIYLGSALMWGMAGNGPFYHYDLSLDNNISLSETYRYPLIFSLNSDFIYFDNNINMAPLSFELLLPSYNETIELNQNSINDSTTFSWSTSQDLDNDSLIYTFYFWDRDRSGNWLQPPIKIYSLNSSDTSITLSNDFIYNIFIEALDDTISYFKWSVDVTDGLHVLSSDYDSAYPVSFNYSSTESQDCIATDSTDGVDIWGSCYSIQNTTEIELNGLSLNDTIPSKIGQLINLQTLSVDSCGLYGELPSEIGDLINLTSLSLSHNELNDTIPNELFNLENLSGRSASVTGAGWKHGLNLSNNQLTGTISDSIINLANIKSIDLSNNLLEGEILNKITNLTELRSVNLSGNQFTGEIPSDIINLTNLEGIFTGNPLPGIGIFTAFDISDNRFSGVIPYEICSLNLPFDFPSADFMIAFDQNLFCAPYPSCLENVIGDQDTLNCIMMDNKDVYNIPLNYTLHQNYPNPFNPITSLRYDLPNDGLVNITVFDMMGRIVKTLVNGYQTAGFKSIQWNATNDKNEPVSAGLYLYAIQAGKFRQTKKMVMLK